MNKFFGIFTALTILSLLMKGLLKLLETPIVRKIIVDVVAEQVEKFLYVDEPDLINSREYSYSNRARSS
jgi:hypothetical protein